VDDQVTLMAKQHRRHRSYLGLGLGLGMALVLGLLYAIAASVLLGSLGALEQANIRKDVRRSLDAIAAELQGLRANTCDYARWDEAYDYMATGDPRFERNSMGISTQQNLGLNILAAVLADGQFRYGRQLPLGATALTPLPPSVRDHLAAWPRQQRPLSQTSEQRGWIRTEAGPMLLVVCAITNRQATALPRGALAMGRYFAEEQIAAIERQLRVDLDLVPLTDSPNDHIRAVRDRLAAQPSGDDATIPDSAIIVIPTDRDRVAGYARLDDVQGQPLALLRVEIPRDLHQQGILASLYLGGSLAIAGVAFGLVGWWLLNRLLRASQQLARSEEALAKESALRQADARYREKAIELEIALGELNIEKERSESLLLNILPESIALQLKQSRNSIAEHFDEVTILFADIVGFTPLSARLQPIELVDFLNRIFSEFDELVEDLRLEKIKTIGDAYMVASGLPIRRPDHAEAIAEMALAMQQKVDAFRDSTHEDFQIRIGINTGMVVAGVIGTKKFIYDLWGDAVNVASRMESSGVPGQIQVTAATYDRLKDRYDFEPRGTIHIKGKGVMETYWLRGKKPAIAAIGPRHGSP